MSKYTDKIVAASRRLHLSTKQVEIMLHALGIEHRAGRWTAGGWRNRYYLTSPICDNWADCSALVSGGWMRSREYPVELGGGAMFYVTDAGRAAIASMGWKINAGVEGGKEHGGQT